MKLKILDERQEMIVTQYNDLKSKDIQRLYRHIKCPNMIALNIKIKFKFLFRCGHQYKALLSVNTVCVFILLRFSFFLNLFFFLLCSFSSSDTASGGSWWCPSWGGEGSPVRYRPGNLVGLISSELGVRATPPGCSALLCSAGLLVGGRKHSVISALLCYWLLAARCPGIGCLLWWRITSVCHLKRGRNRQAISDSLTLNTMKTAFS